MAPNPDLSIIVITHNRAEQVAECLRSIARMETQALQCEIIVVLDSCVDDTLRVLESLRPTLRFPFLVDAVNAGRPSIARNRGAALARGATLLFLDDDITVSRALATEHWFSHRNAHVVIGYLKTAFKREPSFWQLGARIWWEDRFTAMNEPDYVLGFKDLFSANVSIESSLFHSLGGFDEGLTLLEDYEFGIRLLKVGALFAFNSRAVATHWEASDVMRWLGRARVEAESEFHMGEKHCDYRKSIFCDRLDKGDPALTVWSTRIRKTAFRRLVLLDALLALLTGWLPLLEALKARRTWGRLMGGTHEYNYWRSIANHFSTEREFTSWIGR